MSKVIELHLGFDSDTLAAKIPAGTRVGLYRPNGFLLQRYPAQTRSWHLTYRGQLEPGIYTLILEDIDE